MTTFLGDLTLLVIAGGALLMLGIVATVRWFRFRPPRLDKTKLDEGRLG